MPKRLAVVGAGPKGAALAAKAAAMRDAGIVGTPEVTLFDPHGPGGSWSGAHGYTDGLQPLCTLAERDLGFPYDRFGLGAARAPEVAAVMQQRFSWQAFSVRAGSGRATYRDWVLDGRRPPAHADFARYLAYAISESQATLRPEKVTSIDHDAASGKWVLGATDAAGTTQAHYFDGVVLTGSGSSLKRLQGSAACPRAFDAHDFWRRIPDVRQLLASEPDPGVVIVGAGGSGAAVAHWFVRNQQDCSVTIIGHEPTLYARHTAYYEDRLFSDAVAWQALPRHVREAFLRHSTAGVVWESVLQALTRASVLYMSADAVSLVQRAMQFSGMVPDYDLLICDPPDRSQPPPAAPPAKRAIPASVFVDARGFDRMSFMTEGLISTALQAKLNGGKATAAWIEQHIDDALALDAVGFPRNLHLPMLGSLQGPAASNLMALGWMSDSVFRAY